MQNITKTNCQCDPLTNESFFVIDVPCENNSKSQASLICQKHNESHFYENVTWISKEDDNNAKENLKHLYKCVIPLTLDFSDIQNHPETKNELETCIYGRVILPT